MLASFFRERSAFWILCRLAGGVKIFVCGHFPRENAGLHNKLLQPQRLLPSPAVLILGSSLESCSVCVQCGDGREATQAFAKKP